MIGMNTGNSSAAETPFGGIKESGYGKESGKDVAVNEYMVSLPAISNQISVAEIDFSITGHQDRDAYLGRSLLSDSYRQERKRQKAESGGEFV